MAKPTDCAYFNNRYGVKRLCHMKNPQLWPHAWIYNADTTTCPGCIDMLGRRVEYALSKGDYPLPGDRALGVLFPRWAGYVGLRHCTLTLVAPQIPVLVTMVGMLAAQATLHLLGQHIQAAWARDP